MDEEHRHERLVHAHGHLHVTHYLRHGESWEHLGATHEHEHDHAPVTHTHQLHEDPEGEHLREGHIHDHAHPVE